MDSQEDADSSVNVTGTDRKIDAQLTHLDSPDVHGWRLDEITKIDLAWEAVNCLGGQSVQNNSYDQGFVDAIGKALEEIEKLGGKDPSYQRAAERLRGS